jgi:serine/threonine protein kinase
MHHRQVAAEYKEIKVMGRGAFAEVLLAKHVPTSQLFVLKRLSFKGPSGNQDHDDRQAAIREMDLLCALRHPHITLYKESFLDMAGERLNIVLEFCEKGSLAGVVAALKDQPPGRRFLSEDRVLSWATQLLFAISYCHGHNVLHRDIKPANIFLTNKDHVKLGDFGIAKHILTSSGTRSRGLTGTPFYLAPEVCEEAPHSPKSDIWALGVSLYEVCQLRLPFHGSNILAVVRSILTVDPPPLGAPFSPKLSQMLAAMMVKDPRNRPSADDLIVLYLRPEVAERMEREVQRYDHLAPQGIPLQAPKPPQRPKRASSVPPANKVPVVAHSVAGERHDPNSCGPTHSSTRSASSDGLPGAVFLPDASSVTLTALDALQSFSNAEPIDGPFPDIPSLEGLGPSKVPATPPEDVRNCTSPFNRDLTMRSFSSVSESPVEPHPPPHGRPKERGSSPKPGKWRQASAPATARPPLQEKPNFHRSPKPEPPPDGKVAKVGKTRKLWLPSPTPPKELLPLPTSLVPTPPPLLVMSPNSSVANGASSVDSQEQDRRELLAIPMSAGDASVPSELCKTVGPDDGDLTLLSLSLSRVAVPRLMDSEEPEKRSAWPSRGQTVIVRAAEEDPSIIVPDGGGPRSPPLFEGDREDSGRCRCIVS